MFEQETDTWICDGCNQETPIKALFAVDKYVLCVDCEKNQKVIVANLNQEANANGTVKEE